MSSDLVNRIKSECVLGDHGFYMYWPALPGAYSPYVLRLIADTLDEMNFKLAKQIDADFDKETK